MRIFIGTDHNGFSLKQELIDYLRSSGHEVSDEGDGRLKPEDDFPDFAVKVVSAMQRAGEDARGILLCGSGQGMSIAANRFKGIRAALAWDVRSARDSRTDDDSNVLCLPADVLKDDRANMIVHTWLNTPFSGAARFRRRIKELDELG